MIFVFFSLPVSVLFPWAADESNERDCGA